MILLGLVSGATKPKRKTALSLDRAQTGARLRIVEITCGTRAAAMLRQRGFRSDATLSVCHRAPLGGPIWVEIGGAMFAIGRAVARKIVVAEVAAGGGD